MEDTFNLQRFVEAQEHIYDQVVAELRAGRKTSHWMWFIFPQIKGLGHSSTAQHFALSTMQEARAYLADPILGPRLRECTQLVNQIANRPLGQIFGSPDDLKFRSCMTLFLRASDSNGADQQLFATALQTFCGGEPDPRTLSLLHE